MKSIIKSASFDKEVTLKNGDIMFSHKIEYDEKSASYLSKSKDQQKFVPGQEAEFTETEREYNGVTYYGIKPVASGGGYSNYGKKLKAEQSKYSGFATSYVKDLIIANKIPIDQWKSASESIFKFMVELDKTIQ